MPYLRFGASLIEDIGLPAADAHSIMKQYRCWPTEVPVNWFALLTLLLSLLIGAAGLLGSIYASKSRAYSGMRQASMETEKAAGPVEVTAITKEDLIDLMDLMRSETNRGIKWSLIVAGTSFLMGIGVAIAVAMFIH
jgi:hypothetical protein